MKKILIFFISFFNITPSNTNAVRKIIWKPATHSLRRIEEERNKSKYGQRHFRNYRMLESRSDGIKIELSNRHPGVIRIFKFKKDKSFDTKFGNNGIYTINLNNYFEGDIKIGLMVISCNTIYILFEIHTQYDIEDDIGDRRLIFDLETSSFEIKNGWCAIPISASI